MASQAQPPTLLKAAILIVSDTAFKDPSTDKAAMALEEVFETEGAGKWQIAKDDRAAISDGIAVKIVPDQRDLIQNAIIAWSDSDNFMNLIVTTGGTGFTPKDVTPEAIAPLLH